EEGTEYRLQWMKNVHLLLSGTGNDQSKNKEVNRYTKGPLHCTGIRSQVRVTPGQILYEKLRSLLCRWLCSHHLRAAEKHSAVAKPVSRCASAGRGAHHRSARSHDDRREDR